VKILLVTPFLAYPGSSGGGTAIFNLIRNLASRHEIVYLSFARQEDMRHVRRLEPYCTEVINVPFPGGTGISTAEKLFYLVRRVLHNFLSLVTCTPVLVWKCRSRAMSLEICRTIERHRPDLVQLCFPQMAHYIGDCRGVPAVMDTQDVATVSSLRRFRRAGRLWSKAYYFLQWLFWLRYEARFYPQFGKVLTLTRQDAAALTMIDPTLDIHAEAIGVEMGAPLESSRSSAPSIGFLASFAHQPNVDGVFYFARSVLPLVREHVADVEFVVAGKNPPPALLDAACPGVRCVGFVEDVSTFYGSVDIVVAPLRFGGGIKVKVLEAMACGKAVVTTSVGAEGIAEDGDGAFVVADDPSAFSEAVVALLGDGEMRRQLGERARRLIERRFSWQRVNAELDGIYADLARGRR
jgi:glycosyltransferase involved in cell wall biosynthesis